MQDITAKATAKLQYDVELQKEKTPVYTLHEAGAYVVSHYNGDGTPASQPTTEPEDTSAGSGEYTGPRGGQYHYTASGRKEYDSSSRHH